MDDQSIVELYWSRSENAISETDIKYGRYLNSISYNILTNHEDAQECVNDTYHNAWNTMPPGDPRDCPNRVTVHYLSLDYRFFIE